MKHSNLYYIGRFLVLLFVGGYVFWSGAFRPINNWDLIGYVAVACQADGHAGAELSDCVFSDIKRSVPSGVYAELISGAYRSDVFRDHEALTQQIPFYSIRVVYVWGVRLASTVLGVDYTVATHLVSALFAGLTATLLCYWLFLKRFGVIFSFLVLAILIDRMGLRDLARLSSPDSMAAFLFVLLVCLKSIGLGRFSFYLSVLLPLVRTDFLLASWLLQLSFWGGKGWRPVVCLMACSLGLFLFVNKYFGNYGWGVVVNFTFVKQVPYPALMDSHVDPIFYWELLKSALAAAFESRHAIIYLLGTALAAYLLRTGGDSPELWIYVVSVLFVVLHLMLFPAYMSRFFVAPVCVLSIWLVSGFRTLWWNRRALGGKSA